MLGKIIAFGRRWFRSTAGESWVLSAVAYLLWRQIVKITARRTELIDISNTKPGDKILVEHLTITHKEQIEQNKKQKKADQKAARAEKEAAEEAKRADRKATRSAKRADRKAALEAKQADVKAAYAAKQH